MQFLIFFSIVIVGFFLANYYIFSRSIAVFEPGSLLRKLFVFTFWTLAASYFVGRVLERIQISFFSDSLVWIGSFWMGALLYFILIVLLLDVLKITNYFFGIFPQLNTDNFQKAKTITFIFSVLLVAGLLVFGFINARRPIIKSITIDISKYSNELKELNIAVVSDIHLGTIIGNGYLSRVVSEINSLKPDIILIAGDLLDEDLEPVIRQNLGETLRMLYAPKGVFAIMGNHEYIGGVEAASKYLSEHGIVVLKDSVVLIDNSIYIIGRDDKESARFGSSSRKSLQALYDDFEIDESLSVIVLDHQPVDINSAVLLNADVQFSGHTHKGQIWPINYLVNAIFKVGYGHQEINKTNVIVTSGIGTWGPPIRIGNSPEILSVKLRFNSLDELK